MITEPDIAETLAAVVESTAALLRAMCQDPTIPEHARTALQQHLGQLETALWIAGGE